MSGWKQEWDRERFSDREKQDLAARLRQAAEQEESMDNKSKKRIFRLGRGAAVAVAAALMLTVGAMAAAANGTWGGLFRFFSPEEETLLEKITCEVGQTRQADDWEVTLSRCAGDDEMVYIWVDMKAPADFTGEPPADYLDLSTYWDLMIDGVQQKGGGGMISIDWDEESRTVTYCSGWPTGDPVAGRTADIILEPLCWSGWDREAEKWVDIPLWEGDVTFEDVELAYENQTIRLEPNVEVPYLDGTATLTRLDISPLPGRGPGGGRLLLPPPLGEGGGGLPARAGRDRGVGGRHRHRGRVQYREDGAGRLPPLLRDPGLLGGADGGVPHEGRDGHRAPDGGALRVRGRV